MTLPSGLPPCLSCQVRVLPPPHVWLGTQRSRCSGEPHPYESWAAVILGLKPAAEGLPTRIPHARTFRYRVFQHLIDWALAAHRVFLASGTKYAFRNARSWRSHLDIVAPNPAIAEDILALFLLPSLTDSDHIALGLYFGYPLPRIVSFLQKQVHFKE